MKKFNPTKDQLKVLNNEKKNAIVSASAGTGKTATIIEYIAQLVRSGVSLERLLVVTFTNNAANEMKDRLLEKLMEEETTPAILEQIDEVLVSDISTIHSFLQKIIKQNTDKLNMSEDYFLMDQNKSKEIRNRAFKRTYDALCSDKKYENLMLIMQKEGTLLKDMIFALENKLSSQADASNDLEHYENQEEVLSKAEEYLNSSLCNKIQYSIEVIDKVLMTTLEEDKNYEYMKTCRNMISQIDEKKSLSENLNILIALSFPKIPDLKTADTAFIEARDFVKDLIKKFKEKDVQNEAFFEKNELVVDTLRFYKRYIEELNSLKQSEGVLDFNDLEKYALELLQDERVVEELQERFDYIFIDEYQDTNPVQEKIIKTISRKAKFMGVGDPKQGIYGFRNATAEIMEKDIEEFNGKVGDVYFLNSNFRSNPKILNFVNSVFADIMQKQNTGISYKDTSILKGEAKYLDNGLPTVQIDVINEQEERGEKISKGVYNPFEDEKESDDSGKAEAQVIAKRVNEALLGKIYDSKKEKFRNVNYSDITILVRGNSPLVEAIINQFAKEKIPLITTIGKNLFLNEEVEVIKNFLRITLDYRDDIALISYLSSKLGGLSLEQLTEIRQGDKKSEFYKVFRESSYYIDFCKERDSFKIDCECIGIRRALEKKILETQYFEYILYKPEGINQKRQIEQLLDIIEFSGHNYDLPGLISYLDAGEIKSQTTSLGANAVSLTTIHASKGLEYPIVILAGAGKDITKKDARNNSSKFKIDKELGLATLFYNLDKDEKGYTLPLLAIDEKEKRREFADEIMLLYVAMTRAKNNLYIIGRGELEKIKEINSLEGIYELKSYLKLILSALKRERGAFYKNNDIHINYITELQSSSMESEMLISGGDKEISQQIENYLGFSYKFKDATQTAYKNSVTSLNRAEEIEQKFIGGSKNLDIGNAYHRALEVINFEEVNSVDDILSYSDKIENFNLIDVDNLLDIIKQIRNIIKDQKIYKEKQFTMKINLREIFNNASDEEIMIQGIVDLFSLGKRNVLIDYKYSNERDENRLIDRYKMQLFLYKKAIEKAYMINLDEIYLLSLKYGKIIKLDIEKI